MQRRASPCARYRICTRSFMIWPSKCTKLISFGCLKLDFFFFKTILIMLIFKKLCLSPSYRDIRSTNTRARVNSLSTRAQQFINTLNEKAPWDCVLNVPHIHILADHILEWMDFWFTALGWGHGMFSSASGEHLNKLLKFQEMHHTNLSGQRFHQMLHYHRVHAFLFSRITF